MINRSRNNILGLFANSPFTPLQKHASKVEDCSELLVPFFEKTFEEDWNEAEKIRNQISKEEGRADALKREIRLNLPRGLFMPVSRGDLLELVTQQDKLANCCKDVAGRVIGRELLIPKPLQESFLHFVKRNIDSARQAHKVVCEMDNLLESSFRGREVELVNDMILELDVIEKDTDLLQRILRKDLRNIENNYNPIDVMFMYKIIEIVGDIADQAERIGARVEIMLAKS